ncbi:hypothetical protein B0J13DRAFT_540012 [Dactylonectria estremocensis]|uniref:Synaptobrevin n=1 Tax=Dactylonectria estremocensis TaxID=1079267 RepID=A0A9P9FCQ5_9HYPO|nr:hypothetical protein B0J13DRAFT_540012 [Dactylonectria estremocensis]
MARLSQPPGAPINRSATDLASSELGNLLLRLQKTILHAEPDRERRLRTSEFERARVAANLEYARTSLTTLEQDALGIKAPGRRSEVQGDLNRKREMLELLLDRLEDLREMAIDDDDASSDGEDILSEIIPTPSESMVDSISTDMHSESSGQDDYSEPEPPEMSSETPFEPEIATPAVSSSQAPGPTGSSPEPPTQTEPTQTTQVLRSRSGISTPADSGHSTDRAALFSSWRKTSAPETSTATAEAILDRQRVEQDELSNSILMMAGALKESSQRFSDTLEADKEVITRAGDGMEKTEVGMEAAQGRMGTLRKLTEGKGWWGRMILFAWVYGLMVALILLVFVMPKLRF